MSKLHHFEEHFHRAHDWMNGETVTGPGFEATDTGTFEDLIHRFCPYYFDLVEMFGSHAVAKSKVMNVENLDLLDDEKSEFYNNEELQDDDNAGQDVNDTSIRLELNETSFGDDMSSIVTGVTGVAGDDSHRKQQNSYISSSMKKKPHMISLDNDAQSAATTVYAQSKITSCRSQN